MNVEIRFCSPYKSTFMLHQRQSSACDHFYAFACDAWRFMMVLDYRIILNLVLFYLNIENTEPFAPEV